jgi:hypothetical protein
MRPPARLLSAVLLALSCAACGPKVDLTKGLQVEVVNSGWFDAGIVNGQNKLVPSITVRLKNVSSQRLPMLQLNALFRRVSEPNEWGSAFMTVSGSDGLAPGASTEAIPVRSDRGYTGADQSREEMLHNSHFVDAKVELFAKYGSTQLVKVGDYPIQRTLITK